MKSPAERYQLSRKRSNSLRHYSVDEFVAGLTLQPDSFQLESFNFIAQDNSVLVAAPTGSGKTLVAEFGIRYALQQNLRVFYTTPIKALSNQKYRDLCFIYGIENVGLVTGDRRFNAEAPIVVMTTEILRNMLYEDTNRLLDLGWVVMDEVHYLSDRNRGSVWEEVLILLPDYVRLICLSATISNAEEFGDWLASVRGSMKVVVSDTRPVPLEQMVYQSNHIHPLYLVESKNQVLNPAVISRYNQIHRSKSNRQNFRISTQERESLLLGLEHLEILPVIYFIFSRKGCEQAAAQLRSLSFTNKDEQNQIKQFVSEQLDFMSDEDLEALDYENFSNLLERGIATHHAGMIPIFREIVESLFQSNLVKVVFATETLALGINMPAKSVVVESLKKFDGNRTVDLSAGEYTQLTGRAGRRGLDDIGYAVVPLSGEVAPISVSNLASTRTYPLKSNFTPNYNMALNLVQKYGLSNSTQLIEKSLAHYQANLKVRNLREKGSRIENQIKDLSKGVPVDQLLLAEDFLAKSLSVESERRRLMNQRFVDAGRSKNDFSPGSVIRINGQICVVTDLNLSKRQISVLFQGSELRKVSWDQFSDWPKVIARVSIPRGFNPKEKISVNALLSQLDAMELEVAPVSDDRQLQHLLDDLDKHPFHRLSEGRSVMKTAREVYDLKAELASIEERIEQRTGSFGRRFLAINETLKHLDYLDSSNQITSNGHILSAIFIDNDLLLVEAIKSGCLDGLSISELGAVLSAFIFESRMRVQLDQVFVPTKLVRRSLVSIESIFDQISQLEEKFGAKQSRPIDAGFALAAFDWINHTPLQTILDESDLSPGDFVRWVKQLIDLCNQISNSTAPEYLVKNCRILSKELYYGIVLDLEESGVQVQNS